MIKPSYLGLVATGFLILIALILLFTELGKINGELTGLKLINLILFLSTAIGIHSILHFMAEVRYNYNPMETGLWTY
jgi:hypothetical protein